MIYITVLQNESMLNMVYKSVLDNRKELLDVIEGNKYQQIIQKAKETWNDYTPTKQEITIAGIDSSFNMLKFQGLDFWIATVVSVNNMDTRLYEDVLCGLGKNSEQKLRYHDLEIKKMIAMIANEMEISACEKSTNKVDLVLMDGSLHSQFLAPKSIGDRLLKLMHKRNNIIFVAKTSTTNARFKQYASNASDIFYYNHATDKPGFSDIYVEPKEKYGKEKIISYTFVRLTESMPLIKLEFLGDDISKGMIKDTMNKLTFNSLKGYPYTLRNAHETCKVGRKDIQKAVELLGGKLSIETESREVLT